jgi:hypothetical protein
MVGCPEALESTEWWKVDFHTEPNLLKAVHKSTSKTCPNLETFIQKRGDYIGPSSIFLAVNLKKGQLDRLSGIAGSGG